MKRHHIYLIPGFFGFANIGDMKYFHHVQQRLHEAFRQRGHMAAIHYVPTLPTASIRKRAAKLLDTIVQTSGTGDEPIHLIGHSTGGLDARLLIAPNPSLPSSHDLERLADRIRSAVTVSTPHFGTPTAALFTSVLGQRLLRLLSVSTMHSIRLGSVPLTAMMTMASVISPGGSATGPVLAILDQLYRQVLRDFSTERQTQLEDFFADVARDQTLLVQLTPESMDLFNTLAKPRPGVRCGSVITCARPPSVRTTVGLGLRPGSQALYNLYRALYRIASSAAGDYQPELTREQVSALRRGYGQVPSAGANDAMVPTLSQVWQTVVHTAWADHHDAIGHFSDPSHNPPHVDWLNTHSGFTRAHFDALWADVADYILREDKA